MSIICLDTQVIQWGVMKRESRTPNAAQLVARATYFIDWLDSQKADIILPSIVIGELLVNVPAIDHQNVLKQLHEDWLIVDYDLRAAKQFAIMRHDQVLKEIKQDIKKQNPCPTRKQISADVMIIATAMANNADKIYSHDANFIKLAQHYIDVQNFYDVPVQTHFLNELDEDTSEE